MGKCDCKQCQRGALTFSPTLYLHSKMFDLHKSNSRTLSSYLVTARSLDYLEKVNIVSRQLHQLKSFMQHAMIMYLGSTQSGIRHHGRKSCGASLNKDTSIASGCMSHLHSISLTVNRPCRVIGNDCVSFRHNHYGSWMHLSNLQLESLKQ